MPSALCVVAPTGQTTRTARSRSACTAPAGDTTLRVVTRSPREIVVDANPVHLALRDHLSLPTTGMLFSAWQATTHALQPMQAVWSIDMPHW